MNGSTEAMVKAIKNALKFSIGDSVMGYSELQTVMYEAAELVNSRPIGKHPTSPEDGTYLSPNDLLLGRSSANVPQGPFKNQTTAKQRFEFVQMVVDAFWKKWTREHLPHISPTSEMAR